MVGDRLTDIEAGRAAGCQTVLIGAGAAPVAARCRPDFKAASLAEAAGLIIQGRIKSRRQPRPEVQAKTF
jgi:phosphoglycolate phosphatase-like HAD superfamily hydrolase